MSGIYTLVSSDNQTFTVPSVVMSLSITIKDMMEALEGSADPIPFSNIKGDVLQKIVRWVEHFMTVPANHSLPVLNDQERKKKQKENAEKKLDEFDVTFCKSCNPEVFTRLILAADFLNIPELEQVLYKFICVPLQGKSQIELVTLLSENSELLRSKAKMKYSLELQQKENEVEDLTKSMNGAAYPELTEAEKEEVREKLAFVEGQLYTDEYRRRIAKECARKDDDEDEEESDSDTDDEDEMVEATE